MYIFFLSPKRLWTLSTLSLSTPITMWGNNKVPKKWPKTEVKPKNSIGYSPIWIMDDQCWPIEFFGFTSVFGHFFGILLLPHNVHNVCVFLVPLSVLGHVKRCRILSARFWSSTMHNPFFDFCLEKCKKRINTMVITSYQNFSLSLLDIDYPRLW